jgi:GDPmannose 4,6-dehydratase
LNWVSSTTVEQLVAMMVEADLEIARREKTLRDAGHDVRDGTRLGS